MDRVGPRDGGIVEFVAWCIMVCVIKAQNDWRNVGRPRVALHRNCHLFSFVFILAYVSLNQLID